MPVDMEKKKDWVSMQVPLSLVPRPLNGLGTRLGAAMSVCCIPSQLNLILVLFFSCQALVMLRTLFSTTGFLDI